MNSTGSPFARCCALVVLMLVFAVLASQSPVLIPGYTIGREANPKSADIPNSTSNQKKADSREAALAKSLANDLEKAGVEITEKDRDEMIQGMTEGGKEGIAIALFILKSFAEIESEQKTQKKASTKGPVVQLSREQIDVLLEPLAKNKKSAPRLSRFLTSKLNQLKEDR